MKKVGPVVAGRGLHRQLLPAGLLQQCTASRRPAGRIPRASQQHRRLLNSLGGKVLYVFPLDLNQIPTLFNPLLDLALALGADYDYCLLDKLQTAPLVLI